MLVRGGILTILYKNERWVLHTTTPGAAALGGTPYESTGTIMKP
jgi:hypothetical protein